jgi:Cd2+/Zn2+-exporting ATPase/Cu+-exporting ATPase
LGLDEVHAGLLPDEKVAKVKALRAAGRRVAMVGDGINDAPALTESNVGVAMGSGTDMARESADVVLLGNDLLKFVETLQVARRCRRIIWFNFAGTLAVDSLGMRAGGGRAAEPVVRRFHPRFLGTGFHPELSEAAARRVEAVRSAARPVEWTG